MDETEPQRSEETFLKSSNKARFTFRLSGSRVYAPNGYTIQQQKEDSHCSPPSCGYHIHFFTTFEGLLLTTSPLVLISTL